jgi:hypothetical protein
MDMFRLIGRSVECFGCSSRGYCGLFGGVPRDGPKKSKSERSCFWFWFLGSRGCGTNRQKGATNLASGSQVPAAS